LGNIYKEGENRKQQMFFPPSIDEYVSQDNPVRAIEAYVEILDMKKLGFTKAALGNAEGQPAYHPKLLLKIYIYGYLNKIRSSRKLETEIKRNIEMMWLCSNLKPSYKTIADFRKENSKPLKEVFREFVLLCKEIDLIDGELVAVDGAFLRANASKNQLITTKTVAKDLQAIDAKIEEYLKSLEFVDASEKREKNIIPPKDDFAGMKQRKAKLEKDLALLEEMGVTQYNRTDPDAKLMIKPAHNLMAYNVQIAVDSKYKFIVATDVSSDTNDYGKLYDMAIAAKEVSKNNACTIVADAGYYSAKGIKACDDANIDVYVPVPDKYRQQRERGYFIADQFTYDKAYDCYICPAHQKLTNSFIFNIKPNGTKHYFYRAGSKTCGRCMLREQCIPAKTAYKKITHSEYADTVERHKIKMRTQEAKANIKQRASLAEHPFGTIKRTLGWDHFLVRGKQKVSGENALIMLTYNFKRVLGLVGTDLFQKLIKAILKGNIEAIKKEIAEYIACFRLYFDDFLGLFRFLGLMEKKALYT
jgi:transposase